MAVVVMSVLHLENWGWRLAIVQLLLLLLEYDC